MKILFLLFPFYLAPLFINAQELHNPAELLEILEKSTFNYTLKMLEEPIEVDDQIAINSNTFYRIKEGDGFAAVEVELSEKAQELKEEAEALFQKKEYEKARLLYDELLDLNPEYTKLLVYIGQTYHLQGELKKAIPFYQKAVEQNFIDYMAHWFLGRALWDLGEVEDCLASYMVAHLLNRNHPLLMKEIIKVLAANGLEYHTWKLVPQIELERKDSINIEVAYGSGWMGYALAKAVWQFEPSHSEEMGETFGVPSIAQEKEALAALYVSSEVGDKTLKKEPFIISFKNAIEKSQIEAYILYEIFLVQQPSIAYQLSLQNFIDLSSYIIENHCSVITRKSMKKKKKKKKKR